MDQQFQWFQKKAPFDSEEKRLELLERSYAIHGIDLPQDAIGRRLWVPLSVFTEPTNLKQLQTIFDWVVEEIVATQPFR